MPDISETAHGEHYSDAGNARRLAKINGDHIRWVPERGWYTFKETFWTTDTTGDMMRYAKLVPQKIIEASADYDTARRREAITFALRSEQAPRLQALLELAKSEPGISLAYRAFDADPLFVGVLGGGVDLHAGGEWQIPRPSKYVSRRLGAVFEPRAKCPHWLDFLDRIMAGDAHLIDYLQAAVATR